MPAAPINEALYPPPSGSVCKSIRIKKKKHRETKGRMEKGSS
jgi:hypothetical protein